MIDVATMAFSMLMVDQMNERGGGNVVIKCIINFMMCASLFSN